MFHRCRLVYLLLGVVTSIVCTCTIGLVYLSKDNFRYGIRPDDELGHDKVTLYRNDEYPRSIELDPRSNIVLESRPEMLVLPQNKGFNSIPLYKPHNVEKFTLLIQTFNRTDLLLRLMKHFVEIPELDQILIVWNNIGITPPYEMVQDYAVEVVFLRQSVNKMRNRLQYFPEIRTEGMCLIGITQ